MQVTITAEGFEPSAELQKYSKHKITEVTRRVPLSLRADATYVVHFLHNHKKSGDIKTCTLVLTLSDVEFHSQETTQHMYAALDIATADIRDQLRAYAAERRRANRRARLAQGSEITE